VPANKRIVGAALLLESVDIVYEDTAEIQQISALQTGALQVDGSTVTGQFRLNMYNPDFGARTYISSTSTASISVDRAIRMSLALQTQKIPGNATATFTFGGSIGAYVYAIQQLNLYSFGMRFQRIGVALAPQGAGGLQRADAGQTILLDGVDLPMTWTEVTVLAWLGQEETRRGSSCRTRTESGWATSRSRSRPRGRRRSSPGRRSPGSTSRSAATTPTSSAWA